MSTNKRIEVICTKCDHHLGQPFCGTKIFIERKYPVCPNCGVIAQSNYVTKTVRNCVSGMLWWRKQWYEYKNDNE